MKVTSPNKTKEMKTLFISSTIIDSYLNLRNKENILTKQKRFC